MQEAFGIVLKKHTPTHNRMTLLDSQDGLVEYVMPKEELCVGALIRYTVYKLHNVYIINQCEMLDLPLQLAQHDLVFFHQLLELSYYCVPHGSQDPDIFALVAHVYRLQSPLSEHIKQLFFIKFFMLLGMHTETRLGIPPVFYRIGTTSIDILLDLDLNLGCKDDVTIWLRTCIALHPKANVFKTIHF